AVVTRRGDRLLCRRVRRAAVEQPDGAPELVGIEAVQVVTRRDARFAARAGVEIDVEGVLLTFLRAVEGDQISVVVGLRGKFTRVVALGEALDGDEGLLRVGKRRLASCCAGDPCSSASSAAPAVIERPGLRAPLRHDPATREPGTPEDAP